jgi:peptidoglycan/LPS O-acetylase OafA/YrhL
MEALFTVRHRLTLFFTQKVESDCKDHWWKNVLYVNNFINRSDKCMGVSWYLACDFQLFVLSPIVLLPMFKWRKAHRGLAAWLAAAMSSIVILVVLVAAHELPPALSFKYNRKTNLEMTDHFYMMPYTHFPPYLCGILLGYFVWRIKEKENVSIGEVYVVSSGSSV